VGLMEMVGRVFMGLNLLFGLMGLSYGWALGWRFPDGGDKVEKLVDNRWIVGRQWVFEWIGRLF
jgi:hypothetical protein